MLVRVLTMHVVPERLDDWFRFTRDVGFPGMRRQPGCRGIWRLQRHRVANEYEIVTLWGQSGGTWSTSVPATRCRN